MGTRLRGILGTTGLADVGYRFIAGNAFSGSRIASGVYELPGARGVYGVDAPSFPGGATDVYWDSTGTVGVWAYEAFDFRLPLSAETATSGAVITSGVGTAQLATTSGLITGGIITTVSGNVTGSVGSVAGSVGGSVTGSVGSVTGAVGSVTGSVGGNISGSVLGSVTGNVGGINGVAFPATVPSSSQISTAVWQDATAGDFTVASSIGRALYANVAPGAAGGHFIAGSNAATTVATFTSIGQFSTGQFQVTGPGGDPAFVIISPDNNPCLYLQGTVGLQNIGTTILTGATTFTGAVTASNASNDIRLGATERTSIGTTVWAIGTRTLTSFGTLVADIWGALTSSLTTAGSIGKRLVDFVTTLVYSAPPTAAAIDTQLSNTHGSGLWGANAGGGAFVVTITVKDGSAAALQNANVRLTQGVNTYVMATNASGIATFSLDAATYTRSITKDGYAFAPDTIIVTGVANFNATMTANTPISPPSDPSLCTVYGYMRNKRTGVLLRGVQVTATLKPGAYSYAAGILAGTNPSAITDSTGLFQLHVIRNDLITQPTGTKWLIQCPEAGISKLVSCTTSILDLQTLLP